MRLAVVTLGVWWLVASAGCAGDSCDPPDKPEYSCEPVAPGTANTCRGPVWNGVTYDQDKAFPVGCGVKLPACAAKYPDDVQTCGCSADAAGPQWVCPI